MSYHYKALIVVMFLTVISFAIAKPVMTRFMGASEFVVRRNAWLAITLAGFLIPEFWSFVVVASLVILYAAHRDSNPVALFVFLLLVLPPVSRDVPGFGIINYVISISHLRLLCLLILVPVAIQFRQRRLNGGMQGLLYKRSAWMVTADAMLLLYVALQILLAFPYQSVTATARLAMEELLFTWLPYYAVSRACDSREKIVDVIASFVLATLVLVPLALFEFARGGLLYAELETRWEGVHMFEYMLRGDFLRAQVTTGHPIVLGVVTAVALGLWFFLQTRIDGRGWRWLGLAALAGGSICSLSRGPWVGAGVSLIVFVMTGPAAVKRTGQAAIAVAILAAITLATPYGDTVVNYLPFVGNAESGTVEYREQVAQLSWDLVKMNPFFGNPYYIQHMEELRQGQGIIDIVNSYAGIALSYGLIGAGLFLGFFLVTGLVAWRTAQRLARIDSDASLLGAALVACLVGMLVIIATVSQIVTVPYLQYILGGLSIAYAENFRSLLLEGDPVVHQGERLMEQQAWR